MKVFVLQKFSPEQVVNGELYLASHFVEGIFTTKEKAEKYIALCGNLNSLIQLSQIFDDWPWTSGKIVDKDGFICSFMLSEDEVDPFRDFFHESTEQ